MSTQASSASRIPLQNSEQRAFVGLIRAHVATTRRLSAGLEAGHGLTLNDYEVLLHLAHAPDRMMRRVDLARSVLLTPSGITRLLDGLQRCGFVEKAACDTDARVVYAKLTDAGREKLRSATQDHVASIRALFGERFSEKELGTLCDFLDRLQPETAD